MRRPWYGYLLVLSLIFLGVYLWRLEVFEPVPLRSTPALIAAFGMVLAGFLLQSFAWQVTLRPTAYRSSYALCLAGSGLSAFTRYIPGKVFSVLGRAVYVAEQKGAPRSDLSMLSLTAQLVSIWAGIGLGALGLLASGAMVAWGGTVAVGWLVLTVLIFTDSAHGTAEQIGRAHV